MKNTDIQCPKCSKNEVTKRGFRYTERREKIQKYFCKSCNHRFVLDNPFFRMRNKDKVITQCMDLYYSGMSFRKIAQHLKRFFPKDVSHSTIYEIYYNWIREHQSLEGQTPSELDCPNVQIENKNGWLELIQRGYDGK